MSQTKDQPTTESTTDRELVIVRVFDAPRQLVFDAWTRNEHRRRWFAPTGMTTVDSEGDLRVGGAWRLHMRKPDGEDFKEAGVCREVVPGERLVFTHAWEGDDGKPEHETIVRVEFGDEDGGRKTRMTFHQGVFRTTESRDNHNGGWSLCFDGLESYLARAEVVAES